MFLKSSRLAPLKLPSEERKAYPLKISSFGPDIFQPLAKWKCSRLWEAYTYWESWCILKWPDLLWKEPISPSIKAPTNQQAFLDNEMFFADWGWKKHDRLASQMQIQDHQRTRQKKIKKKTQSMLCPPGNKANQSRKVLSRLKTQQLPCWCITAATVIHQPMKLWQDEAAIPWEGPHWMHHLYIPFYLQARS